MVTIIGIANPRSGLFCNRSEGECRDLAGRFAQTARAQVRFTRNDASIDDDIRQAFLEADVLAVLGGDGATARAYNAVAGLAREFPRKAIASVPAGSGCAVKYEFGISGDLMGAGFDVRNLSGDLEGNAAPLDLILVNGTRLAMFASIGAGAPLIDYYEHSMWRGRSAKAGYAAAVVRNALPVLLGKPLALHQHHDDDCAVERAVLFVVTKFRNIGNGYMLNPEARHDDGLLHCRSYDKMAALKCVPAAQRRHPAGKYFTASRLEVAADVRFPYEMNGDVQEAANHLTFEVVPDAVRVLRKIS